MNAKLPARALRGRVCVRRGTTQGEACTALNAETRPFRTSQKLKHVQ